MNFKLFLNILVIFHFYFSVGFSQRIEEITEVYGDSLSQTVNNIVQETHNGSSNLKESIDCMQKLMPCQPYLKLPETAPATCCVPLKDMITTEAQCLCSVLTNARVLQSFNVTEADAMNLLKVCGAQADLSSCKNGMLKMVLLVLLLHI